MLLLMVVFFKNILIFLFPLEHEMFALNGDINFKCSSNYPDDVVHWYHNGSYNSFHLNILIFKVRIIIGLLLGMN